MEWYCWKLRQNRPLNLALVCVLLQEPTFFKRGVISSDLCFEIIWTVQILVLFRVSICVLWEVKWITRLFSFDIFRQVRARLKKEVEEMKAQDPNFRPGLVVLQVSQRRRNQGTSVYHYWYTDVPPLQMLALFVSSIPSQSFLLARQYS